MQRESSGDMTRFFIILDGDTEIARKGFSAERIIVGRSRNADIQIEGEDVLISRAHLEVWVEAGMTFIKDVSSHGSLLNGKKLEGEVSLNHGDLLKIGKTSLMYEEAAEPSIAPKAIAPVAIAEKEPQATSPLDPEEDAGRTVVAPPRRVEEMENELESGGTRGVAEDGTRMLDPKELPGWKNPGATGNNDPKKSQNSWAIALFFLFAAGSVFLIFKDQILPRPANRLEYRDPELGLVLDLPSDWTPAATTAGTESAGALPVVAKFVSGSTRNEEWIQLEVRAERKSENELMGLSYGFRVFQDDLRRRYKQFEMIGSKRFDVNDVSTILFQFTAEAGVDGWGVFLLDGEKRISMEFLNAANVRESARQIFREALDTLYLRNGMSQQFIDFPLPDSATRQFALGNPAVLAEKVGEEVRLAKSFRALQDVRPDNLAQAISHYREALRLSIALPSRLPNYNETASGLLETTRLLNNQLREEWFKVQHGLRVNNSEQAYASALRIIHMVEPGHHFRLKAEKVVKILEPIQRKR